MRGKAVFRSPITFSAASLALVGALLAGCDTPTAREQVARRHDSLRRTVELAADSEAGRPEKLDRTFTMLAQIHERDVERTRGMPAVVGNLVEEEFDRWNERQPAYREAILRELQGNPESIERTLPYVVY
jgi:hypothetical protein